VTPRNPAQPTFSVILPTFNRPEMLQRAVESVLAQDHEDFELIVVDDGSNPPAELSPHLRRDSRLVAVRREGTAGAGAARNHGIAMARGRCVAFLDDDDEYLTSFLSATWASLRNTSDNVALSWCGARYVADHLAGREAEDDGSRFDVDRSDDADLRRALISIGTGHGVAVKLNCLKRIGLFDNRLRAVEDSDLFLRLLIAGYRPVRVPGVHVIVHDHDQGRLTDPRMHEVRRHEAEALLVRYGAGLRNLPSVRNELVAILRRLKLRQAALPDEAILDAPVVRARFIAPR
jgi:glycosyltransferase involved in cell wall biosynthesis